jgi:nucleoid DNA-binding protein
MPDVISKSELIQRIAEKCSNNLTRDEVKQVLDALADVGHAELRATGAFLLPGFAKFVVVEKPATPARDGVNPFTKEPMRFEAKPASKALKARPVKAIKDAVS